MLENPYLIQLLGQGLLQDNNLSFCLFFQVVHADGHDGQGVNLDICRGGKEDPTTFFRDGVRKIDFVMVRKFYD